MVGKLDKLDLKIIDLLKDNGRLSYRKIAHIIGRTEATVRRRVKYLIDEKFIIKFTVEINEEKLNLNKI